MTLLLKSTKQRNNNQTDSRNCGWDQSTRQSRTTKHSRPQSQEAIQ